MGGEASESGRGLVRERGGVPVLVNAQRGAQAGRGLLRRPGQLSGVRVAVCPSSSTSITVCSLIPGYLRRWPASHGQQWATLDCPGPYSFGGLILMPDGHPPADSAA